MLLVKKSEDLKAFTREDSLKHIEIGFLDLFFGSVRRCHAESFIFADAKAVIWHQGDGVDTVERRDDLGNPGKLGHVVVKIGNYRDAYPDFRAGGREPTEIFKNTVVADTGEATVQGGIGALDVVEIEVADGQSFRNAFPRHEAGGVDGGADALAVKTRTDLGNEVGLEQALAARKRHAAVSRVKCAIAQKLGHQLVGGHYSARRTNRLGRAYIDVIEATVTTTASASDTLCGEKAGGYAAVKPFGVVTPRTAEIAALHKDGGADTRAVVHRKALYIKNRSVHIFHPKSMMILL